MQRQPQIAQVLNLMQKSGGKAMQRAVFILLGPAIGAVGLLLWHVLSDAIAFPQNAIPVLCLFVMLWVQTILVLHASPLPGGKLQQARRMLRTDLGLLALMVAALAMPQEDMSLLIALGLMATASVPAVVFGLHSTFPLWRDLLDRQRLRRVALRRTLQTCGSIALVIGFWAATSGWTVAYALWAGIVILGAVMLLVWPFGLSGQSGAAPEKRSAALAEAMSTNAFVMLFIVLAGEPVTTWAEHGEIQFGLMIGGSIGLMAYRIMQPNRTRPYRL